MTNIAEQDIDRELILIMNQLLMEMGMPYKRQIRLDAKLQEHLVIDSLARAELFQRIEKHFQVSIPDQLLSGAKSLQEVASYLKTANPMLKVSSKKIIYTHGEKSSVNPDAATTLIDLVLLYGQTSPNKPHIFFQHEDGKEETITCGELLDMSLQVAKSLQQLGLREGETVAIMQPTHPGFFYTFLGTLLAGGIPVPIYPPFRTHMLEAYAKVESHILRNAQVRILVTFQEAQTLSQLLGSFVPSLKHVVTVDDLLKQQKLVTPFHAKEDHFAFIQYTSGSTNDPKGVLLTHANLMSNIRAYGKGIAVTPDDITVSWLPLYHDMGLIGMWLGSLYYGVPLILMTPFTFLSHPERWLWAIHYHRGTISGAPNFAYELCVRKIDVSMLEGLDLSCWRIAANGAEKIYPRTLEEFVKKFAPFGFKRTAMLPVYGLAESTVGLSIPPLNREFRIDHVDRVKFETDKIAEINLSPNALQFVSCGFPMAGHEVRIVDQEGQVLPERHVGGLQFRGPSSMQGYYNNPRATQAIYHDGWYDSGDLAYLADGEIFITGRHKDLIIKAGRNLYPVEMEELIGSINGVRRGCVAVFGVTDYDRGTEDLIVVAETKEQDKDKRQQIIEQINETLSTNLDVVADKVVLVAPQIVPKTSSGKLQRSACKKLYLGGQLGKSRTPAWLQIGKLAVQGFCSKTLRFFYSSARFLYSIYAFLMFVLTLTPVYFVVLFASRSFSAKLCRVWARVLMCLVFCPIKVIGADKIKSNQVMIFAANHASYLDTIVALTFLPPDTRFVGKKEILSTPVARTLFRKLAYLSVDRTDLPKGLEDTKNIVNVLKEGHPILIFPEGTFGYASGLRPFRLGAFKMAVETGVSVCPIALQGTRAILRDDVKFMRPHRVTVTICDPIAPKGEEWTDVTELRQAVRAEIAKYCGEPSLDFIAAHVVAPRFPR